MSFMKRDDNMRKTQLIAKLSEKYSEKYSKGNRLKKIFIEKIVNDYINKAKQLTECDLDLLE